MIITDARYLEPAQINVMLNDNYAQLEHEGRYSADLVAYQNAEPQSGWHSQKAAYEQYLLDYADWQVAYQAWVDAGSDPETGPPVEPEVVEEQSPVDPDDIVAGVISEYDAYFGWDETQAYEAKESEIDSYGENLITDAYSNPIQGVTENPTRYRKKVGRRKSNKADKIAGEIPLDSAEKDESKSDEKLSEYETKITADQDKATTNLHKLSGVSTIMNFDVPGQNWNVWTPK